MIGRCVCIRPCACLSARHPSQKVLRCGFRFAQAWLNGEGTKLPVKVRRLVPLFSTSLAHEIDCSQMEYDTTLADRAYALASSWNTSRSLSPSDLASKFSKSDLEGMSSTQIVLFLETLGTYDKLEEKVIEAVERAYGFDASADPEIRVSSDTSLPFSLMMRSRRISAADVALRDCRRSRFLFHSSAGTS